MIYVDNFRGRYGRMIMCHMMSDESVEELHEFAARLGLKREWFQTRSAPHYDVCLSKRKEAIALGAKELPLSNRQEWRRVYRAAKQLGGQNNVQSTHTSGNGDGSNGAAATRSPT